MGLTCRDCIHFNNDPAWLERVFPGLNALSSAYGSARGEAGICNKRDIYLSPIKKCAYFEHMNSNSLLTDSSASVHDKSSEEL
jgi:hypothetical protein